MEVDDIAGFEEPAVEFLILADHVEAVHGKLYMMGGGWENIAVHDFESPVTLEIATGIQVPWNATNRPHTASISVQTVDAEVLAEVDQNIVAGRPANIEHGATQRTILSLRMGPILPEPGTYVVAVRVNDASEKRVTFRAVAAHHHH